MDIGFLILIVGYVFYICFIKDSKNTLDGDPFH